MVKPTERLRSHRRSSRRVRPTGAPIAAVAALIAVVAEKTGYPAEVLELDMRLDDDLGIDSIKRVEILSALQEQYPGLPALPPDRLASFRTLGRHRGIPVAERREHRAAARGRCPPRSRPSPTGELARALLETVAEKTGYPAEMLELDMRLDDDLGIDSIKRVEILSALQERFPEMPPASPEQIGTLGTLREIVALLADLDGAVPATAIVARPSRPWRSCRRRSDARATSSVARILLEAVAEKTGYPAEMLELDMRLDDDLGIDSIKRVEILSAVQDGCPRRGRSDRSRRGRSARSGEIVEFLAGPPSLHRRSSRRPRTAGSRRRPSVNGTDSHVTSHRVVLRRLEPRAVPLADPERREAVRLPAGGSIWIIDDGSPLTHARCDRS